LKLHGNPHGDAAAANSGISQLFVIFAVSLAVFSYRSAFMDRGGDIYGKGDA